MSAIGCAMSELPMGHSGPFAAVAEVTAIIDGEFEAKGISKRWIANPGCAPIGEASVGIVEGLLSDG